MSEIVFQITEDDTDGGFIARAIGHSIITEAGAWDELRSNVGEAVLCHFDEGQALAVIRLRRVFAESRPRSASRRRSSNRSDAHNLPN
jgi:hypothetical protein